MEKSDNTTFHVGICMAGAISAGAYTAGVMDYLLETLEHWEKAKRLQEDGKLSGIPKHNILIEVLGGASAGGMTAAVTSAALQQKFEPVTEADLKNDAHTKQNPLFNAWVNLTETPDRDMMSQMLATDDIEKDIELNQNKEVRAGFNSTFIKKVADNLLDKRLNDIYTRPYIASNLDVFATITNLRGYNYAITFETATGPQSYSMKMHRDYAFFKVGDDAYDNDGRIPISFKTANKNEDSGKNIVILKQAAMSTGAFPVGLESRTLNRRRRFIEDSKYLNLRLAGENDKRVDYSFLTDDDFESLNVDGGVINNEPFEITQQLINDRRKKSVTGVYEPEVSAAKFDSTVVMIDPFPSDPPDTAPFVVNQAWKKVLPSVLSAMIGQLRLKETEIKRAYLNDDYTRFLVAPSRTVDDVPQLYTIACGSLGGFGGFFSKAFREHDFLLGRRNCQRFLQHHFSAPQSAGNAILSFGYYNEETIKNYSSKNAKGAVYLPLIPDLRVIDDGAGSYKVVKPGIEGEYTYPAISVKYVLGLKDQIKKRIGCLAKNFNNPQTKKNGDTPKTPAEYLRKKSIFGKVAGFFGELAFKGYVGIGIKFGKSAAADIFIDAVINDMAKRGLIEEYKKIA